MGGIISASAQSGQLDIIFCTGAGPNGKVENLAIQPDGKVIIISDFTEFNGTSRPRIARVETRRTQSLIQPWDGGQLRNLNR